MGVVLSQIQNVLFLQIFCFTFVCFVGILYFVLRLLLLLQKFNPIIFEDFNERISPT